MAEMITRQEAIVTIRDIINSGILSEDITDKLEDIAICIEEEQLGYHRWNADDDFALLHIAHRSDLWTDELIAQTKAVSDKYSFKPAPYEVQAINDYIKDLYGEDEEEDSEDDATADA